MIDTLLHIYEVGRPGRYSVRRMVNQVGLTPVRSNTYAQSEDRRVPIRVGPEFYADVHFGV